VHDRRMTAASPPASLLLVHGAGSGQWIYDGWADEFASLYVASVDLHEGLDVGRAAMAGYANRVRRARRRAGRGSGRTVLLYVT
jgi:hypothetical protein